MCARARLVFIINIFSNAFSYNVPGPFSLLDQETEPSCTGHAPCAAAPARRPPGGAPWDFSATASVVRGSADTAASLPRSVAWETGNRCASECRKCEIGTTSVRVRGEREILIWKSNPI